MNYKSYTAIGVLYIERKRIGGGKKQVKFIIHCMYSSSCTVNFKVGPNVLCLKQNVFIGDGAQIFRELQYCSKLYRKPILDIFLLFFEGG